jgi:ATP-dependent DNA ligase
MDSGPPRMFLNQTKSRLECLLRVHQRMPSTFDFCIPTRSTSVPNTPDWLHEIKHDCYRLRLERDGDRVHLITKAVTTGPTATRGSSRQR